MNSVNTLTIRGGGAVSRHDSTSSLLGIVLIPSLLGGGGTVSRHDSTSSLLGIVLIPSLLGGGGGKQCHDMIVLPHC